MQLGVELEQTAVPKTDDTDCGGVSSQDIPNNIYGYGRIDAMAAYNAALAFSNIEENDLDKISISIFPNPTDGEVTFEIQNWRGEVEFELYDLSGRLLKNETWNLLEYQIENVDLSDYPAGAYFYKIKNAEAEKTGKIFKN